MRCHLGLGSYGLTILHAFSFHASPARIRPGCPGKAVRQALSRATTVRSDSSGSREVLTFVDDDDHTLLTLRARG